MISETAYTVSRTGILPLPSQSIDAFQNLTMMAILNLAIRASLCFPECNRSDCEFDDVGNRQTSPDILKKI